MVLALLLTAGAGAQEREAAPPKRAEIWDLQPGMNASQLPDEFVDLACGAGAGAPALAIGGWGDYRRCRPESSGLREVFFRYDDEFEYWARANDLTVEFEQFVGTKAYGFPILASALIDDAGVLRGLRIASDPRSDDNRQDAYLLKNYLTARFGRDGWTCADMPAEQGESAVDGVLLKQNCTRASDDGTRLTLNTRHLRKAGQSAVDPRTGRQTRGQFESMVRFELLWKRG